MLLLSRIVRYCLCVLIAMLSGLPVYGGSSAVVCPKQWMKYRGSCYRYFSEPRTFKEADHHCKTLKSARLVSIHNEDEACAVAKYVATFKPKADVWIGIHDPLKKRIFQWVDGSRYNLEAWVKGQPNYHKIKEYCGQIQHTSRFVRWVGKDCSTRSPYVCKRSPHVRLEKCH